MLEVKIYPSTTGSQLLNLAWAKIIYQTAAVHTPTWIIHQTEVTEDVLASYGILREWDWNIMVKSVENVGLNMVDFWSFYISMKAVRAPHLYKNWWDPWTVIDQKYLENSDTGGTIQKLRNKSLFNY